MAVMNPTRREFFSRVLLGAAATVPVMLIGRGAASALAQDRIDVDFDDLVRNFSAGTVRTNRTMAETVGFVRVRVENVKRTVLGSYEVKHRRPVYLQEVT